MTVTEQTDSWRSVIESRGLDLEETDAPDESGEPWFQAMTRFTKRGFLRAIISPREDGLALHVQLAVPGTDDHYGKSLKRHLNSVSAASWETSFEERPWMLDVKGLPQEKLADVIDTLEMVGDHISRAESGEASDNLADEFEQAEEAEDDKGEEASPEDQEQPEEQEEETSGGVFESIGSGEAAAGNEDNEDDEDDEESTSEESGEQTGAETGDAVLDKFSIRVTNGTVRAELELVDRLDERAEHQLLSALARTLRARLDVKLLARSLGEEDGKPVVKLALEPATLGAVSETTLGELSHDLARYLERLKKFNTMGLSLLDVLSPGSAPPASERSERSERRPRQAAAEQPRPRRRDDERRPDSEESGVVFSFGGIEPASAGSDVVQPGDFTDPRIRREDATTPLVDVVLRHPGYTDKSMRQVLSILLDVDYFEAGKLAKQAPCVIAWGISQERAQDFKRVIERAGGRVTLVEPDSLSS
jgi:ribosomal protein L7/L12